MELRVGEAVLLLHIALLWSPAGTGNLALAAVGSPQTGYVDAYRLEYVLLTVCEIKT